MGSAFLAVTGSTASCAPANTNKPQVDVRTFICEGGIEFSGQFHDNRVVINTQSNRYVLKARRSSIGVRYGSETVAFAQDEERAFLIGAAGGPYQNCTQDEYSGATA